MIGQRTTAEPSIIRRATEMWPEGLEVVPYATSWKPLYPFPGSPVTGGAGSSGGAVASQAPTPCDIEFVRGDSVSFDFFFPGVCWTTDMPSGTLPVPWEAHVWNAQVRDPNHHPADPCQYYCGGWIPIWGGLPTNEQRQSYAQMTFVTEFMCKATWVPSTTEAPNYATYGTLVTLSLNNTVENSGSQIYPADSYMWDLQRGDSYLLDPGTSEIIDVLGPVTMLQGGCTVLTDYTFNEVVESV
jgi:hypothetical protein